MYLHYFSDDDENFQEEISREEALELSSWFQAPRKAKLKKHLKKTPDNIYAQNPLEVTIPFNKEPIEVLVGLFAYKGTSIERKLIKIKGEKFVKVCFPESVSYVSSITINGRCFNIKIQT